MIFHNSFILQLLILNFKISLNILSMGCLDSVPEDSPENRVKEREDALGFDRFNGSDVLSTFFCSYNKKNFLMSDE